MLNFQGQIMKKIVNAQLNIVEVFDFINILHVESPRVNNDKYSAVFDTFHCV